MLKMLKNTWELFKLDWRRIYQNKLTLILMVALMIIPSLYAWFNIAALWDPYSNTEDIKIAVYSDDKTVSVRDQEINIGNKIVDNLKDNKAIGWVFVASQKELDKGVKSGKFYGGIYLPENFSSDLISFTSGDIVKPEIIYSVNQKINAIAPKIADKGANTIKENISQEFVSTVSDTLMQTFNTLGFELDKHSMSIDKISATILKIDNNLNEIDGYAQDVFALQKKMPDFEKKLEQANEFSNFIPEINKMADKLVKVNGLMPKVNEDGHLIVDVQAKIPELEAAGQQVSMIDADFAELTKLFDQVISEASNGLEIITDAQKVLPEVSRLVETTNQVIPKVSQSITSVQNALPEIAKALSSSIQIIKIVGSDISRMTGFFADFVGGHELTSEDKTVLKEKLTHLTNSLTSMNTLLTEMIQTLTQLQELADHQDLASLIQQLHGVQAQIAIVQAQIKALLNGIDHFSSAEIQAQLLEISQAANNIVGFVNGVEVADMEVKITATLTEVQTMLSSAQSLTNGMIEQDLINRLNELLSQTTGTLQTGIDFLKKYQKELPAVKQEIHSANELLNGNMETMIGAINTGATIYQNDLPILTEKLNSASLFVQNELPGIEEDVLKTLAIVNEKMPKVESALETGSNLIEKDWPKVREGIQKSANLIRKGQKDIDLSELIKVLKYDAGQESDFMSNPVLINQHDVYPVPNNGSASAPFYTALCLWVGAVLFSSIATTDVHIERKAKKRFSKRAQFLARLMTFLVVGFFQALIVSVGNIAILGIYSVSPVYFVLFSLLVGLVFMAMVYSLVALFGNLGKGAAVIILVLSISAGGGNYPIEMSGLFFRLINPFLPFTYAVILLREPVGGIYWLCAMKAIIILTIVGTSFVLVAFAAYPKVKPFFRKLNQTLQEGHILH